MAIHRFDADDFGLHGVFSGFLHDAECAWEPGAFDRARATATFQVKREYYEDPRESRGWLLGAVAAFRTVLAEVTVSDVTAARITPARQRFGFWRGSYLEFAEISGLELRFYFGRGEILLTLARWAPVVLRDLGPPSTRAEHRYHGWGGPEAFAPMAEELLRRRSDG